MKNTLPIPGCLIFLSLSISVYSQTGTKIGGEVKDSQGAIPAASISLLKANDSSVYRLTVTDRLGNYSLSNIPAGAYLIMGTAIGHSVAYSSIIDLRDGDGVRKIPSLLLEGETKNLKEVTVISRKPMVEQKIDRMVVNVDAAVTNVGANALEVLEKSPGVQVDKDGNISLKGKQGVMILLDGRPTYLSGTELANLLKGMEASQLDQIEIMTNPPAKYDAAGNSGVINIKTKKNKKAGFNGSITAGLGQGFYFRTNESINLNYRKGNINLFGNYSFGRNNSYQQLDIFRRYKNDDKTTRANFEQTSLMRRRRMNNNIKLGMDYSISKNTILGVVVNAFDNPNTNLGTNTSFLKNPQMSLDSIVMASSYIKEVWKNGSVNLNLRTQFDTSGRELSADLDYIRYDASNDQFFTNTTYTDGWVKKYDELLSGDLPISIDIYSAKVDYTHPLGKDSKLEAGIKSSYVETDSRANYFQFDNNKWEPDYRKTNFFRYKENVNAAYINFRRQLTAKLGIQAGLRYENTHYTGFQFGNPTVQDSSFSNSYGSLFPTLYFSYKANEKNQFTISYGRRIDRPDYGDLNPFLFFIDKYTYGQGNPFLKPQYSNNFEISHMFKQILTTTVNYSDTKDLFVETFDQPDNPGEYNYATIVRQGNIGRMRNAGIAINVQTPVTKWLTTMIYTNLNYSKYEGLVNGEMVKAEAGNLMVNMNNQFRFNEKWSAEISGWYRSKGIEGQISIQPMGELSAGISRQVLKGKGAVKVNMRDILSTRIAKGNINFKSTEARFVNTRDSRVANITFTYRFGKPLKGNAEQRRHGSAGEEQNRVKAGD